MTRSSPTDASSSLGAALLVALATAIAGALLNAVLLAQAVAQTPATAAGGPAHPSPVTGMLQGMLGLAVVVALIFAAGWLMRKIGPRARASGLVHVVGGASVGPREKVVVVRFGDQTLLLGVAPGQVSVLHSAHTVEVTKDPADGAADEPVPGTRFVDRLRAARGVAR